MSKWLIQPLFLIINESKECTNRINFKIMEDEIRSISGIDFDWHNPNSASELMKCVKENNITKVKKLLQQGRNPNIADNQGLMSLHYACASDSFVPVLKLLIEYGGYVNHRTHSGLTPLCIAAYRGSVKVVKLLLSSGASLNVKTNIDTSPIHFACFSKNLDMVVCLEEAGASLDDSDYYGTTPLIIAVKKGELSICEYLLKKGVNPLKRDSDERTPLHHACDGDKLEVFSLLIKYSGLSLVDCVNKVIMTDGWSLLMEAAQFRAEKIITLMIEKGTETCWTDDRGLLPLHIAAHNSPSCFSLLLDHTPVSVINKYCSHPTAEYNSLPCLLIDKSYFSSVKLLVTTPDVSKDVLVCPIERRTETAPDSLTVGPISLLVELSDDFNEVVKLIQLYVRNNIPIEPNYLSDNIQSVTDSLITFHNSHNRSDRPCHCGWFFVFLLKNGAKIDIAMSNVEHNSVLLHACRTGSINCLSFIINYAQIFEPGEILKSFCHAITSAYYNWTRKEIESVRFLASHSTNAAKSESLSILLNHCNSLNSFVNQSNLKEVLYSITFESVHSLKFLSRVSIRIIAPNQTENESEQFRKFLRNLPIPLSLIDYLNYADLTAGLEDLSDSSVTF